MSAELTRTIFKTRDGLYEVIGASGDRAGWLERLYGGCGWRLVMRSRSPETFRRFQDAKAEAIKQSELY